jgi:hypothetical protein
MLMDVGVVMVVGSVVGMGMAVVLTMNMEVPVVPVFPTVVMVMGPAPGSGDERSWGQWEHG